MNSIDAIFDSIDLNSSNVKMLNNKVCASWINSQRLRQNIQLNSNITDHIGQIYIPVSFNIPCSHYDSSTTIKSILKCIDQMNQSMKNSEIVFTKHSINSYQNIPTIKSNHIGIIDKLLKTESTKNILNVWLAEMDCDIIGYAQYPWDYSSNSSDTDGIVFDINEFNLIFNADVVNSCSFLHQLGHWLGLHHSDISIIGQQHPNYIAHSSIIQLDQLFGDIMDYNSSNVSCTFNQYHISTMRKMIHTYRSNILNSHNLEKESQIDIVEDQVAVIEDQVAVIEDQVAVIEDHIKNYCSKEQCNEECIDDLKFTCNNLVLDASYDFEDNWGWIDTTIQLSSTLLSNNAKLVREYPCEGLTQSLRLKRNGSGTLQINLSGKVNPVLTVMYFSKNRGMTIRVKPPGGIDPNDWYIITLNANDRYEEVSVMLPEPYISENVLLKDNAYSIQFAFKGDNKKMGYIGQIQIWSENK